MYLSENLPVLYLDIYICLCLEGLVHEINISIGKNCVKIGNNTVVTVWLTDMDTGH